MAVFGLIVATAAQSATAPRDPAQLTSGPGWDKACEKVGDDQRCQISREQPAVQNRSVVEVTIVEGGGQRLLQVAVPPGAILPPGIQLKIDAGAPISMHYVACTPRQCLAVGEIKPEMITRFKRGKSLVVTMLDARGKQVEFDVSLLGFTAAYDSPALESQASEETLKRVAQDARDQVVGQARGPDAGDLAE